VKPNLLDELGREAPAQGEERLERHVLPEGHQLDLVVAEGELPRGVEELRPDVDAVPLRTPLPVVVAEEEVDLPAPRRVPEKGRERRVLVEEEGHR
jgi:hypothetical protein